MQLKIKEWETKVSRKLQIVVFCSRVIEHLATMLLDYHSQ